MTISDRDQLVNAIANNNSRFFIDKASIANAVAGTVYSKWRATGTPGQGAIPTTTAVCNNTTTGSIGFTQQTSPATSYMSWLYAQTANALMTLEFHDRLAHMGGLNGTLTTAQTVDLDLNVLTADNIVTRRGDTNFSDVTWWMEWYTDTGATASNATINVTYNDGTSGNLTVVPVGGTVRASRAIQLNGLIPAADSGKFIRDINTVTLSASTGTAGNFGFTASRHRTSAPTIIANKAEVFDWAQLGLPEIHNSSCLMIYAWCVTTTTGLIRSQGKISHG